MFLLCQNLAVQVYFLPPLKISRSEAFSATGMLATQIMSLPDRRAPQLMRYETGRIVQNPSLALFSQGLLCAVCWAPGLGFLVHWMFHGQKDSYSLSGLPRWFSGKESTCSSGELGLIPGWGRSYGEGKGYPLQYSYLENSVERGAWWADSPQDCKESETTEQLTLSFQSVFNVGWGEPTIFRCEVIQPVSSQPQNL